MKHAARVALRKNTLHTLKQYEYFYSPTVLNFFDFGKILIIILLDI